MPSFFLIKKKGDAIGELEGRIRPDLRFSSKYTSSAFCSSKVSADALNWREQEENQPKTNTNQLPRKYSMIEVNGMCL